MIPMEWVPGFDWNGVMYPDGTGLVITIRLPEFGVSDLRTIPSQIWETYTLKFIDKSKVSTIRHPADFSQFVDLGEESFAYSRPRVMLVASRKNMTFQNESLHTNTIAMYHCGIRNLGNHTCETLILHDCLTHEWAPFIKNTARTLKVLDSDHTLADLAKLQTTFPRLETNCDGDIGGDYRMLAKWFPRYKAEAGAAGWASDGDASLDWLLAKTSQFIFRQLFQRKVVTFLSLKPILGHDVARLIAEMHVAKDISLDGLDKYLDDESCKLPYGITRKEYALQRRLAIVDKEMRNATAQVHSALVRLDNARKRERELMGEYFAIQKTLKH